MAKANTEHQRIAQYMRKATPEERQKLFDRLDELHSQGIRLDHGETREAYIELQRIYRP